MDKRITRIQWGEGGMGSLRLASLGKIKIGGKGEQRTAKSGNKYRIPKKFDHFVITTRERGADENFVPNDLLMKRIAGKDGGQLWRVPVVLLYDNPELNFPHRLACYDGQTLACQGDGTTARQRVKGTVDWKDVECPCEMLKERKCKPHGILSVVLPDDPRVGAVYEFSTTSWETVRNLYSSMLHIAHITGGILAGIPLALELYPATDTYDDQGKSKKSLSYKVALTFQGNYQSLAEAVQGAAQSRLAARVDMKALEGGRQSVLTVDLSDEEHQDTAEEFFPDEEAEIMAPIQAPRPKAPEKQTESEVEVVGEDTGEYADEPEDYFTTPPEDESPGPLFEESRIGIVEAPTKQEQLKASLRELGEALEYKDIGKTIDKCGGGLKALEMLRAKWMKALQEKERR